MRGGPLMLLTREVLRERMAWFLPPPVNTGSLKMESMKTESTNEGPRNDSRLESSSSSRPGTGVRPVQGMLADLGSSAAGVVNCGGA